MTHAIMLIEIGGTESTVTDYPRHRNPDFDCTARCENQLIRNRVPRSIGCIHLPPGRDLYLHLRRDRKKNGRPEKRSGSRRAIRLLISCPFAYRTGKTKVRCPSPPMRTRSFFTGRGQDEHSERGLRGRVVVRDGQIPGDRLISELRHSC